MSSPHVRDAAPERRVRRDLAPRTLARDGERGRPRSGRHRVPDFSADLRRRQRRIKAAGGDDVAVEGHGEHKAAWQRGRERAELHFDALHHEAVPAGVAGYRHHVPLPLLVSAVAIHLLAGFPGASARVVGSRLAVLPSFFMRVMAVSLPAGLSRVGTVVALVARVPHRSEQLLSRHASERTGQRHGPHPRGQFAQQRLQRLGERQGELRREHDHAELLELDAGSQALGR